MFHVRSASDPPSPTSAPAHWNSRPVTPLASQPDNADAYASRPLPPLPPMMNKAVVPPPLNISKRKSKPNALPVGPGLGPASTEALHMEVEAEARTASPRLSPRTPARNSNLPPRMLNPPSPVHSLKHRQSKKVLQLMGYDVDVSNLTGNASQEPEKEPVARSSRTFEDPFAPKSTNLLQPPDEGLVPVLEDDDGMASLSSKKSSWGPGSPHSASAIPLGPKSSVRRRRSARIFEQDGVGQFLAQDDAYMSPAADPEEEEYLSDEEDMTAGEYHKFAAELAASSVRKTSSEEPVQEPKGRRSSIMSFRHGSQFGRLRRRPTTADPNTRRTGSSSSAEGPSQAPAAPEPEPEEPAEPKSMFEESSDSDSDRPNSRSRWRRDRFSHRSEERVRDSRDEDSLKRGSVKSRLLGVGRRRRDQQAEHDQQWARIYVTSMVDVIWTVSTPLPGFFVLLHFDTTSTALLSFWVSFYGVKRALLRKYLRARKRILGGLTSKRP
ncbi:hypothetical protein M419DRAFT_134605 [Trichoderma reesei RUT C-30]|uniref:Uncharacterized protein n=1 Tax=Hypocrea jecorina (strain ATCC 56765 / BCRC 32924 / NRRL 11460 / Rut C-30) TaxID=1344414 RepID=A0A024RW14_HYPJR|nr:hypothetical protein M419DRAFT_134605 [Trichoderma reesei RUT C-30]